MDANTYHLNRYLDQQEKQEKSLEILMENLDDRLVTLQKEIAALQRIASCFDGYDFTEEINEAIKDLF